MFSSFITLFFTIHNHRFENNPVLFISKDCSAALLVANLQYITAKRRHGYKKHRHG